MTPAHGRPPSTNPKTKPFQMRLSEKDFEILEACKNTYGLSKSATFLFGLEILEAATKNSDLRQLIDAIVLLKQAEDMREKYEAVRYEAIIERQLNQIKFNFNEFITNYKK